MAYLWQAQVISAGRLTVSSPPSPKSFLVPFVVDYGGKRFGKYPIGWPVVLGIGERLGNHGLVNPILAGFGLWLSYQLVKRLCGETVAILAAGLTLTSPFFLMNSASLLSHPLGLVLSLGFVIGWLDAFCTPESSPRWLPVLAAGASLGLLALSRPFTAVAIGLPFAFHGVYLFIRSGREVRRRLVVLGLTSLGIGSLHLLWQYAATGDPFINPYTLWWKYDKVGFGPGVGRIPGGHTLYQAWINTRFNIFIGQFDLFGWAGFSWIFLPFGLYAILRDRNWRALLTLSVFFSLFILYFAYWIGAWIFGPRYYYEGLYSITMLSGVGIAFLAGWPTLPGKPFPNYAGMQKVRPLAVTAFICLLVVLNLVFYTPQRLEMLRGLYGVRRSNLDPFLTPAAERLTPALIVVHARGGWIEYGTLLELESPFLDSPFLFILARNPEDDAMAASVFPDRNVYHYYPSEDPFQFFPAPRPVN